MKNIELFAGVGGFRQALSLLQNDFGFKQETVAFSEIDEYAAKTYKSAFDTSNEIEIGDIVSFCDDKEALRNLPNFELLTGGFPCQAYPEKKNIPKNRKEAQRNGKRFREIRDKILLTI